MNTNILKNDHIRSYIFAAFSLILFQVYFSNHDFTSSAAQYASPLMLGTLTYFIYRVTKFTNTLREILPYFAFFTVSILSVFGLAKTLDGSHADTTVIFIWGISFYSASLALWMKKNKLELRDVLVICNPATLITGPVVHDYKTRTRSSYKRRLFRYTPYLTVGIFFFLILGFQLGKFLWLIEATDLPNALLFGLAFELFVYFNFSGASLIIYACAGIFGVTLPLNFKQPFSASNIVEFWRGWHTSLSFVLRELFYTPTRKVLGTSGALFTVYLASALWHGVTANFILWGLFHAILFISSVYILRRGHPIFATLLMFPTIVLGRIIFADSDFNRLLSKLTLSASPESINLGRIPDEGWIALAISLVFVSIEFFRRRGPLVGRRTYKHLRTPLGQFFILTMLVLFIQGQGGALYAVYGQR